MHENQYPPMEPDVVEKFKSLREKQTYTQVRDLIKQSWLISKEKRRADRAACKPHFIPLEIILARYAGAIVECSPDCVFSPIFRFDVALYELALEFKKWTEHGSPYDATLPKNRTVAFITLNQIEETIEQYHKRLSSQMAKEWSSRGIDLDVLTLMTRNYVEEYIRFIGVEAEQLMKELEGLPPAQEDANGKSE